MELVTQDLNHYACLRLMFFNPAFVGRDLLPSILLILVAFKKVINRITVLLWLYAGLCQNCCNLSINLWPLLNALILHPFPSIYYAYVWNTPRVHHANER